METTASSPLRIVEDLLLGPTNSLHEREKALAKLRGSVGEADLGPLEEIQEAAPAVDEGRELRRREVLGAAEEELLDEDMQRRQHARRA
jgi:hypothetical protein